MRAMYYEAFEATPEIRVLPDPTPAPGGVVIKVEATGLCRSDWHGWMGHDPDIRLPHVPGHELAGRVVAVGKAVRRFREGERVTVPVSAIVRRAEMTGLYVQDGSGKPLLRQVRLGRVEGDRVEVLSGVAPGDAVVLDPLSATRAR